MPMFSVSVGPGKSKLQVSLGLSEDTQIISGLFDNCPFSHSHGFSSPTMTSHDKSVSGL